MNHETMPQPSHAKPHTFIVQVMYQQNGEWQGVIKWIEGRKTQNFRSANELLGLIDNALTPAPDEPESAQPAGQD